MIVVRLCFVMSLMLYWIKTVFVVAETKVFAINSWSPIVRCCSKRVHISLGDLQLCIHFCSSVLALRTNFVCKIFISLLQSAARSETSKMVNRFCGESWKLSFEEGNKRISFEEFGLEVISKAIATKITVQGIKIFRWETLYGVRNLKEAFCESFSRNFLLIFRGKKLN